MIKFICRECGKVDEATDMSSIANKGKRCIDCINIDIDERNAANKEKNKKNRKPIKEVAIKCSVCEKVFIGKTASYCSSECRNIGRKLFKLEQQAKQIASLKRTVSIEVYGANIEKGKGYIKDRTRKHIDD